MGFLNLGSLFLWSNMYENPIEHRNLCYARITIDKLLAYLVGY